MRAIVTGGQGFIGFNLCKFLRRDWMDWQVLVVDDESSGKNHQRITDFDYVNKPIQTPGLMEDLVNTWKPDVIFHFAATPRVAYSVEHAYETTESNLMGTMAVLESIKNKNVRLVNSGSSSIYGGADTMPTPEDERSNPQSPYAMQKWHSEEWGRMYANLYGTDVVTLRYFNVFGPHSYYGGAYSTVLSGWLYNLYIDHDVPPFLEGDGTQSRDFCYVDNVVQANVAAALREEPFAGEPFNIAQGSSHTLLDCKKLLEKISGKTLNLEMRPPRVGDVKHTLADISAAKLALDYTPQVDFESQVKAMADWYQTGYVK